MNRGWGRVSYGDKGSLGKAIFERHNKKDKIMMALKLHVVNRSFCFFLFLFLAALSYVLPCCNISDHRNIVGHCHGVVCILCLPLGGLSSMSAFWACYEIMLQCRPRVSGLPASYSLVVLSLPQQRGYICYPWPCYFTFLHFVLLPWGMFLGEKKKNSSHWLSCFLYNAKLHSKFFGL